MARAESVWKHTSKHKTRRYSGHYEWDKKGRRFVLSAPLKNGKTDDVQFESHQMAKSQGYKKVK